MFDVTTLNVGDRVGVGGHGELCPVKTVARRTATQVILDDGTRWNKRGRRIGDGGWARDWLMTEQDANERNEEARAKQVRRELVRMVRDFQLNDVSDDGLRMMLQVAKDHKL